MNFGLHLGTRGAAAHPDNLRALAERADARGFAYLGMSDHIIFTKSANSIYPYSASGKHPVSASGYCLDQLSCLTYIAAVTRNIRLLTSVMVVPHRPAILTAKILATLDVLSKGRVTVGAGVGWLEEEMTALGSPPYAQRGAASNEYIQAFRTLWRDDAPVFEGRHVQFRDVVFEPKPVQRPHIPIWIGGEGAAARRRAGRIGDGWYPTIRNPREPLHTPALFAAALAEVRKEAEQAGRNPAGLDVAMFAPGYRLGKVHTDGDGARISFTGTAEQIAEDCRAFGEAGARTIVISFESDDVVESLSRIDGFADEVMPLVR